MVGRVLGQRRATLSLTLGALLALLALFPHAAVATTQTKFVSAAAAWSASPGFVGVPDTATVTLGNEAYSTQSFGSAELTFNTVSSSAVQVAQGSLPTGWSSQVLRGTPAVVLLSSQNGSPIPPGGSLSVQVTITPAAAGTLAIVPQVKQSNDFSGTGNGFVLDGSSNLAVQVITLTLQFSQQPSSTIGQSLPSTYFAYFCPPVRVQTAPVASGVPITITFGGAADPGLVDGTSPVGGSGVTVDTDANGLATFGSCASGLGATNIGTGFTLSASSPAASSPVTSTSFQVLQTCSGACTRNNTSQTTGTTGTVSASDKGSFFQIFTSFGQGVNLNCDSAVTAPGFPADPLYVEAQATAGGVSGELTFVFPKTVVNSLANNGTPLMPVCAGATKAFLAKVPYPGSAAYPFQGLLYDCTDPMYVSQSGSDPLQMCVKSRAKIGGGAEQIVVDTSNLSDPSFW